MEEGNCCNVKPNLEDRSLIDPQQAGQLSHIFKVLSNSTRLRLLHALIREPNLCVSELADSLGMKPQAVSNQLQRLADKGIVDFQRNGNHIHYRIVDPCVITLLDRGLCLTEDLPSKI